MEARGKDLVHESIGDLWLNGGNHDTVGLSEVIECAMLPEERRPVDVPIGQIGTAEGLGSWSKKSLSRNQ